VTSVARTANVLGALALVVTDRMEAAIAAATGLSATAAAAVSALHQFLDQPSIDKLRDVLGLTPSGAVRLVDRLAAAGLVVRSAGADGRSRAVTLTPTGRRTATRIETARAAALRDILGEPAESELAGLDTALSRLIDGAVRGNLERRSSVRGGPPNPGWTCRLCDLGACERSAGACPTANAAATYLSATTATATHQRR